MRGNSTPPFRRFASLLQLLCKGACLVTHKPCAGELDEVHFRSNKVSFYGKANALFPGFESSFCRLIHVEPSAKLFAKRGVDTITHF